MAAEAQGRQICLLLFLVQVPSCHAFAIPSIAIYGMVAGGALLLVLSALLVALCIKNCQCRRKSGDGDKTEKKSKDLEKGIDKMSRPKKNGFFTSSKKTKKDEAKGTKKSQKIAKIKTIDEKQDKLGKKGEKDKKNKDDNKKDVKNKTNDKKYKDKLVKGDKKTGSENEKSKENESKAVGKWKNAVTKINAGKSEVAPAKGSKVAWTIPADKKENTTKRKSFGFGKK